MSQSIPIIRMLPRISAVLLVVIFTVCGCGFNRLDPLLPDAAAGLTLADIRAIQQNTALTLDERREAIREAIDAPDDEDGDRLVNFLLNLNVP